MKRPAVGESYWHVFARGARRLALYYEVQDYREFLMFVREALIVSGCLLYGFCLMGNHYHLILRGSQAQLSRCMQRLNWRYALYHNDKYRLGGHVFDGPYQAFRQRTFRYLLWRLAYVFLNPVVAGLADRPEDYPWSGYRSFLDLPGSPLQVIPLSVLASHMDFEEAFPYFDLLIKEQLSRPRRKSSAAPTAREVNLLQFNWLRSRAVQRCAGSDEVDPVTLALYWGRQAGIPPRVMASCFDGLSARTATERARKLAQRMQSAPDLAKRIESP